MFRRGPDRQRRAIDQIAEGLRGIDTSQLAERVQALRTDAARGAEATALLPDCLALTAEAASRVTGVRPSEVDLAAGAELCSGVALDDRQLTDPALVLALPTVLRAVAGGVHLLAPTQQDAARHAAWLRPVAELLGLGVSLLAPGDDQQTRRRLHRAEIVCGEVTEFAYDVLRDWLTDNPADRVHAGSRAAVVDQLDVVLLDRGDHEPTISGPVNVSPAWHQWAADAASRLRRDEHFTLSGYAASLSPAGFTEVMDQLDLSDAYRDHAPVFRLVRAALVARLGFRRGVDYEIVGDLVMTTARGVPARLTEALTVHEGLPLTTVNTVLAVTTVRRNVLRYPFVTGIGLIDPTAARRLRESTGLRVRAGTVDSPGEDDVVVGDDEARLRAVRAATRTARDSGRTVILAAATDEHLSALPADLTGHDQVVVVGPDDPVPTGRRDAVLIGVGRARTRRRDVRLALATESARHYLTMAELTAMAGDDAAHTLAKLRAEIAQPMSSAAVTTFVADRQNHLELSRFYQDEARRVLADLRAAQLDELTEYCAALFDEQTVSGLQRVLRGYLDTLVKEHRGRYADLRDAVSDLYPTELPPRPPANLASAVRADADRALAERVREVEDRAGADAMARLIDLVVRTVRDRNWRGHLVDLDTLSTVCGYTVPANRFRAEFTARAAEQFSVLWREVVRDVIGYVHHVELGAESG